MEEVVWDKSGKLRTYSPSTYKIPAVTDTPDEFNVEFLKEVPMLKMSLISKKLLENLH